VLKDLGMIQMKTILFLQELINYSNGYHWPHKLKIKLSAYMEELVMRKKIYYLQIGS